MQIKDRMMIKIEAVAFGGEGVGRVDNVVVFVPFSAPGDELEIEITQKKKKFLRGKILKIIKQSTQRTEPRCLYYEKCGGCCYQHLDYEYQLFIKQKQVQEAFWKIGKITQPPVMRTIGSPKTYHYRGKAQLHAEVELNRLKLGFLDVSGNKVVDIENCEIMEETINEKMRILHERKHPIKNERELTIWSDVTGEQIQEESIIRIVKGRKFSVHRDGFFQANVYLTDRLVDEVCNLMGAGNVKNVVDAYCGSGLFSIFLSPYAECVTGIEIDETAVKYAQINADNLGAKNVKFIRGNVDKILRTEFLGPKRGLDLVVLDPPRGGCRRTTLKSITDLQPQSIIYISCNPATQARDVQYLIESGYDLKSLLPIDMFPQTEHVEVVGFMVRR